MNTQTAPTSIYDYEPLALELALPWVIDEERERKFRRALKFSIAAVIIIFTIMQFLPVFTTPAEVPELAKTTLIMEPHEQPKEPELDQPEKIKPKPVKKIANVSKKTSTKPKTTLKEDIVSSQGLDALSSQLASLTNSVDLKKMRNKNVTRSDRGKVAQVDKKQFGRDQITQRSGGVQIDENMMRTNASQLAGRKSAEVEGIDFSSGLVSKTDSYGELRSGLRDMESIRRVLESAKSRVYSIYQRELSNDPNLAGKFMFRLIIEPDGRISELSLLNSELGISTLEKAILDQIRRIKFGEDDVISTTVKYTFNFLPS